MKVFLPFQNSILILYSFENNRTKSSLSAKSSFKIPLLRSDVHRPAIVSPCATMDSIFDAISFKCDDTSRIWLQSKFRCTNVLFPYKMEQSNRNPFAVHIKLSLKSRWVNVLLTAMASAKSGKVDCVCSCDDITA